MPRFLIEVPHDSDRVACTRAVKIFLTSGSHFLSHADWGCFDGDHHAWMIVEVADKEEARRIVPPAMREEAKVVRLNKFEMDKVGGAIRHHEG
jgi:hypothetical protein